MRQVKLLKVKRTSKTQLVEVRKIKRRPLRLPLLPVGWVTGYWRVNYHFSEMGLRRLVDCRYTEKKSRVISAWVSQAM